jgi:hemerythrin superfamily protein
MKSQSTKSQSTKSQNVKLSPGQRLPGESQSKPAMVEEGKGPGAIALLKADHREVEGLLEEYEGAEDDDEKQALAQQICNALSVHAQVEEELFYPAAREVLDEEDLELVNEADVEHESIKQLIAEVEGSTPDDDHFDARVKVIGEYVKHHVKEEENELFPKLKETDLDRRALGAQMAQRKSELMAELGTDA